MFEIIYKKLIYYNFEPIEIINKNDTIKHF